VRASLPPKSKRTQLGTMLALLAGLKPAGQTDVARCLHQVASMIRGKSLVILFSDLLTEPGPVLQSVHHLRHRGHEVILFHILDEAEVHFPCEGVVEFEDVEDQKQITVDARGMRPDYLKGLEEFREMYRKECAKVNVDYVAIDTSVGFDKALMEYLIQRQRR